MDRMETGNTSTLNRKTLIQQVGEGIQFVSLTTRYLLYNHPDVSESTTGN